MKFCTKCNEEYAEGKFCKKCGTLLTEKKIKCSKCGTELDVDAKFCPECGNPVGKIKCPKCGMEYEASVKFCTSCGTRLQNNLDTDEEDDLSQLSIKDLINREQDRKNIKIELELAYRFYLDEQNFNETLKWLRIVLSGENVPVDAYWFMGLLYQRGQGVTENPRKAFELFSKASELNFVKAKVSLGNCFMSGYGCDESEKDAFKLFKEAYEIDKTESDAAYYLGICYIRGLGINKNESLAFKYFKIAEELNNDDVHYWLGSCYEEGIGTVKDPINAFNEYKKGHEAGDLECTEQLGECYFYGFGIAQDQNYGIQLIQHAADEGIESAVEWLKQQSTKSDDTSDDALFERLRNLVAEKLEIDESKITMDSSIRYDLGADSLDLYELIYAIEEDLGVSIPDEKAKYFETISDAYNYIKRELR